MWILSSWTSPEQKEEEEPWLQCKQTIFFNMYIVHEYLVEDNVLTKHIYLPIRYNVCIFLQDRFLSDKERRLPCKTLMRFIVLYDFQCS